MVKLGQSLEVASGEKGAKDVQQTLTKLDNEWSQLDKLWSSRNRRLEQGLEFQKLNMEANRIEATISGHEARLKVRDLGVNERDDTVTFHFFYYSNLFIRLIDFMSTHIFVRGRDNTFVNI